MKSWVSFSIWDSLLLQVTLFTSACFFSETRRVPKMVPMLLKAKAIAELATRIRVRQVDDSTILAIMQMVISSWYWGQTSDLQYHIHGLKRMIEMRGGFNMLGLHGFLAKIILVQVLSDILFDFLWGVLSCTAGK